MSLVQRFRQHLRLKVIALTLAILIVGFGGLVILNIRRAADALVSGNRETAQLLTASITKSIENGMLEGHPDVVLRLVQELKSELKDLRVLDVFRRNGVEAFSDLKTVEEIDAGGMLGAALVERLTKTHREPGKTIRNPLFTRAVETLAPQETYETTGAGRSLTFFRPLENRKACQDCHGEDHKVRGVVRVSLGPSGSTPSCARPGTARSSSRCSRFSASPWR